MQSIAPKLRASVSFRAVIVSVVALWVTYFILATVRWEVVSGHDTAEMMQLRAIVVLAGMGITLILWLLLRLFDSRPLWMKMGASLLLALPVALLTAQVNNFVFENMHEKEEGYQTDHSHDDGNDAGHNPSNSTSGGLLRDVPATPTGDPTSDTANSKKKMGFWAGITDIALSRYFMMLAWSVIYFSLLATAQVRVAERREQMFRNAAKAAELRSLRYQVNPHFLFNTLNSLSALVMTGKAAQAEQMIQTISSFYRHSLTNEPTSDVALEQEFDLQKHYLNIEEVRFPERLKTEFDLPDDLVDARVPGMILQPLVENSVKYAVSPFNRPITVKVAAREEFDRLVITVTDNGPGVSKDAQDGFGIGLANVRDRLEARFGPDIEMTSGPIEGGYKSEIRIPLTRNG
ncbi:MAG: histidine kinase [Marinomonas sp.]